MRDGEIQGDVLFFWKINFLEAAHKIRLVMRKQSYVFI